MTEPLKEKPLVVSEEKVAKNTYAILMETSGEECESWYYFIKYQGNEEALKHLQKQLEKIDMYIIDDLSTFDLELDFLVSETTAKEMTKVDLNKTSFHRKFDGTLKTINLKIKDKHGDEKKLLKLYKILGNGGIEDFIDQEDLDPEDIRSHSTSSEEEADGTASEEESDDGSDASSSPKKARGKPAKQIPVPRYAQAKKKHR